MYLVVAVPVTAAIWPGHLLGTGHERATLRGPIT